MCNLIIAWATKQGPLLQGFLLPAWGIVLFTASFKKAYNCMDMVKKLKYKHTNCHWLEVILLRSYPKMVWWSKAYKRSRGRSLNDETATCKIKYERGRTLQTAWIFGGVERISKRKFLITLLDESDAGKRTEVGKRSADNLLPDNQKVYIARDHYLQGNIHTQTIERLWRYFKEWTYHPGMRRRYLKQYIP